MNELFEQIRHLRPLAESVRTLTEAPGNELPDEVFNLMAAVLYVLDNSEPPLEQKRREGRELMKHDDAEFGPVGVDLTSQTRTMWPLDKAKGPPQGDPF